MKKLMISFTEPQVTFLRNESQRLGISLPELVRRIIDEYREGKRENLHQVRQDEAIQ